MKELDLQIAITSNGRADRRLENTIENLAQTTNTVKIFHGTEIVFRMSKPAGLKGYPELCIEAISTLEEYRAEQRRMHYEALLPTKEGTTRGATKI
ncbi:hypothetical protein LFL96_25890 [Paraburkholderia sp. D15]|uniref:hypothetical protein n=1 Tax=Paraburkholderia sp. D15 TaxID=2880218 RepID=UPI002478C615|nr:hypothetical protein [Paraburkholderia sp. D15]WGS54448.1 hypothetical protein LFL96_25890 [Paraburkholderia sp. D15]